MNLIFEKKFRLKFTNSATVKIRNFFLANFTRSVSSALDTLQHGQQGLRGGGGCVRQRKATCRQAWSPSLATCRQACSWTP